MKYQLIIAAMLLNACRQQSAESSSGTRQGVATAADAAVKTDPNAGKTTGANKASTATTDGGGAKAQETPGTIPANAVFAVSGLPVGSSDQSQFTLSVIADPRITYYSYKLGTADDCSKSTGYQILPVASQPALTVPPDSMGKVALCLLRYYAPTKTWQTVANATVISWDKVTFHRVIKAVYSEYDEDCKANVNTTTEIEFTGTSGTYKWSRDARSQGCDEDTESGTDKMTVEESTADVIKGFWAYDGADTSGWYNFKWSNADRSAFTGTFGYGDPNLTPAGSWNSLP